MKHLIFIIIILASCGNPAIYIEPTKGGLRAIESTQTHVIYLLTVDSCEYIVSTSTGAVHTLHKYNCKNHK